MWGAYRAFFDNNILADWVHIDDIDSRDFLYFPYPIMLEPEQAKALGDWVRAGGTLIAEACPGYFGKGGRVGTRQPNMGLDALFGVEEVDVEFMPDIADRNVIQMDGRALRCAGYRQCYRATGGTELARFDSGETAIVEHRFGNGRTLLIGSHLSASYHNRPDPDLKAFFRDLLVWAGRRPGISCSNAQVQARLHSDGERAFLWLVNPERSPQSGHLQSGIADLTQDDPEIFWGKGESHFADGTFRVAPQDALILSLPLVAAPKRRVMT